MLLTCSFPCSVFIMSEASATIAMTTSIPVPVVGSSMSSLLSTVTLASSLMGPPVTSGQHYVALTPRNSGDVVGLAAVPQQQPQFQIPLQAYANYAIGPLEVGFSFRVEPPTIFLLYVWCLLWCIFQLPGAMMDAVFTNAGSAIGVCTTVSLWSLPMAGICTTWQWSLAHTRNAPNGCSYHCFE